VPLFPDRFELAPAPPVKNEGLFATAGLPEPEPPAPAAPPFVAIAVGKTNEGESFPANPGASQLRVCCRKVQVGPTKFRKTCTAVYWSVWALLNAHLCTYLSMTTAGVWEVMLAVISRAGRRERWRGGSSN